MAVTSPGTLNTPGIISAMNVTLTPSMLTDAAATMLERTEYDAYLYGRTVRDAKTFVPAAAPPVLRERLDLYERMMTGPRPVPDYPIPLFVGDYVNGIILPADWDPNGHIEGQDEWQNRTRFFSEGRLWNYKRIPLAPRLLGS